MKQNIILGCLLGLVMYMLLLGYPKHTLKGGGADDTSGVLQGIDVENTCVKLQKKLRELKNVNLEDRNSEHYWSMLSCSKILSYSSMKKVASNYYHLFLY